MIGTTISHYRIVGSIGVGGMGVVYLAADEHLNRKIALKFLPPPIAQNPQARARLVREAQAASALDHPNIATVYDVDEWNGQSFIAMSYYEGETLRARIERGPPTIAEAARIAGQIASGLAAAHRAGIVHRDVKPANVMLLPDGQVKILDFGLAKIAADTDVLGSVKKACSDDVQVECERMHAERYLRQSHSGHAADAMVNIESSRLLHVTHTPL